LFEASVYRRWRRVAALARAAGAVSAIPELPLGGSRRRREERPTAARVTIEFENARVTFESDPHGPDTALD
jgi:hypothetical protein